jgi:N-acetylneuraminate synthase/sialic acid synthase
MEIRLENGIPIGDGHPTFVIAEVGSNWHTLDDCVTSIHSAKKHGADAVKFQYYTWNCLYGPIRTMDGYKEYELERTCLDPDWLPILKIECMKLNMEFMCTAFSPMGLQIVNQYVNINKLASSEITHVQMIDQMIRFQKPFIFSTGALQMSSDGFQQCAKIIIRAHEGGNRNAIPMYCVGSYPAKVIDLKVISLLKEKCKTMVGYSDHSIDVLNIPDMACDMYGASILEKHVNFVGVEDTPDAPHSISGAEFGMMVENLKTNVTKMIYEDVNQEDMYTTHRRRLVAIKPIEKGERLYLNNNYGVYRSLKKDQISSFDMYKYAEPNGMFLNTSKVIGDSISAMDICQENPTVQ